MFKDRIFRAADAGGANGGTAAAAPGAAAPGAESTAGGSAAPPASGAQETAKPSLAELLKDPAFKVEYDKAARSEAERLATLSEDQRKEEDRKAFETERAQFQHDKLETETVKQLAARGLPVELASQLTGKDATETLSHITTFETAFKAAVERGVNDRLKGTPPKAGGTTASGTAALNGTAKGGMMSAIAEAQFKR